jgi:alpha-1,2-mannosyltransferase
MLGVRFPAVTTRPAVSALVQRRVSDAWLIPGVAVLIASLGIYVEAIRRYWYILWAGLDLAVYRGGGAALRSGQPVYDLGWTKLQLPYTYPPITLFPNAVLSYLAPRPALAVMTALSTVCLAVTAWLALGMAGVARSRGRVGLTALATAGALWLEPMLLNANLGQVNAVLMVLVLADLALPDRRRWKGIGIGLAAGAKLVPGIFIVYLLLTRRFRAAAVAAGTFLATVLVGFVLVPGDARTYWGGAFLDSHRVASVAGIDYLGNQSLHGFAARLLPGDGGALWLLLALLVGVGGLALSVLVQRRGQELLAVLVVALTALLVSPVAWAHHWVWVLPLLIFVWVGTARLAGRRQLLAQFGAVALTAGFVAWPYVQPAGAPLVPIGLIWRTKGALGHGLPGFLLHDLYSFAALAFLAGVVGWLWRTRGEAGAAQIPAQREPAEQALADQTLADQVPADQIPARTVTVPRQKRPADAIDTSDEDRALA